MEQFLHLASANLLSPLSLFFLMGVLAGVVKSDLEIPDAISKALAIYLITAIGYKGGVALNGTPIDRHMFVLLGTAVAISFFLPFYMFALLKLAPRLKDLNRAAIVAHYGSVSLVTFTAALTYLNNLGFESSGHMIAVLAIMETPAILAGLVLARITGAQSASKTPWMALLREVFLNGTVILLLGSFLIGALSTPAEQEAFHPFFISPFKGVLSLFLLEMGILVGRRLEGFYELGKAPIAFALLMPPVNGLLGALIAAQLGLNFADQVLFTTLVASASYIAVPAALRIALPKADVPMALTLSLGITFPMNILIGIPFYTWLVQALPTFTG